MVRSFAFGAHQYYWMGGGGFGGNGVVIGIIRANGQRVCLCVELPETACDDPSTS